MKNYADLRKYYPPWPLASADNTFLHLHNSSYDTQAHPIIFNCWCIPRLSKGWPTPPPSSHLTKRPIVCRKLFLSADNKDSVVEPQEKLCPVAKKPSDDSFVEGNFFIPFIKLVNNIVLLHSKITHGHSQR